MFFILNQIDSTNNHASWALSMSISIIKVQRDISLCVPKKFTQSEIVGINPYKMTDSFYFGRNTKGIQFFSIQEEEFLQILQDH